MPITKKQLQVIHATARRLKLDDAHYRLILRNLGDAGSAKDLDQAGFENVMAQLEHLGGGVNDYWRRKVEERATHANSRQVRLIRALFEQYHNRGGRYPLHAIAGRLSGPGGGTALPSGDSWLVDLPPRQAWSLIEALKQLIPHAGAERATAAKIDHANNQGNLFAS